MQLMINELQVCQMGGADGPIADRWVESGAQTGKLKPHLLTRQHTHIQVVSVTTHNFLYSPLGICSGNLYTLCSGLKSQNAL